MICFGLLYPCCTSQVKSNNYTIPVYLQLQYRMSKPVLTADDDDSEE